MQVFNKGEFSIIAETYNTRFSWGHKATLLHDGREIAKAKIRYYNRTWEKYTYQSVCFAVINTAIDNRTKHLYNNFRDRYQRTRLTKEMREDATKGDIWLEKFNKLKGEF